MKKVFSLLLVLVLLFSTAFSDFQIDTKLSTTKQEAFKLEINKIYKQFDTNLSKLANDRQKVNLETIVGKINELIPTQKNDTTIFILSYLKYLLEEKLEVVSSVNLGDILKLDEEDEKVIEEEKAPVVIYVPTPSDNSGNPTTPNTPTIAKCYVSNGEGQEKFINGNSQGCEVVSCNYGYEKIGNQCLALCNNNTHREGESCLSNEKTCEIQNGAGTQIWNGNSWGSCNMKTCNSGFFKKSNICEKINLTATRTDGLSNTTLSSGINDVLVSGINLYANSQVRLSSATYSVISNNDNSMGNIFITLYINGQSIFTQTLNGSELFFDRFASVVGRVDEKGEELPSKLELRASFSESFTGDFQIKLTDLRLEDVISGVKIIPYFSDTSSAIFTIK